MHSSGRGGGAFGDHASNDDYWRIGADGSLRTKDTQLSTTPMVLGGALVCALVFSALAIWVARRPLPPALLTELDQGLRVYPGAWRYDLVSWMRALGSGPVVVASAVAVAATLWRAWGRMDLAAACIAAPLLAGLAEAAVRSEIDRPLSRGAELSGAFGYGFPSGHTAGVVAIALTMLIAVAELVRDWRVVAYALAAAAALVVAVASSSVIGGAHRSLDVVGGFLLGAAAALTARIAVGVIVTPT